MKKILNAWIATTALIFGFVSNAQNPEAEDLSGKQTKRPGDSLVVRIDANGNKTVYSVNTTKKLNAEEFKAAVKKLEAGDEGIANAVTKVNPEAEDLGVAPSWYYRGGYNNGYYNAYHYGYGHTNYGYYGYPRYYNSYRYNYSYSYSYGYYYQPYYSGYAYGNCNWYYYY